MNEKKAVKEVFPCFSYFICYVLFLDFPDKLTYRNFQKFNRGAIKLQEGLKGSRLSLSLPRDSSLRTLRREQGHAAQELRVASMEVCRLIGLS